MAAINELDAFCVVLPSNLCPFTSDAERRYLAVVNDESLSYRALGGQRPYFTRSGLIGHVCTERASDTVDRQLIVNGQPVRPEAYIERWRVRLASALTLDELATRKQLQVIAVFEWWHDATVEALEPSWSGPPFVNFGALLALHASDVRVLDRRLNGEIHGLQVDLAAHNGARDAWWAAEFLESRRLVDRVLQRRLLLRSLVATA